MSMKAKDKATSSSQNDGEGEEGKRPIPMERPTSMGDIAANESVRQIILALRQGKEHTYTLFPPYPGFRIKLLASWNSRNEEIFFQTLTEFFKQAQGRLPHLPRPEQVTILLQDLRTFMDEEAGFYSVARYILSAENMNY